MAEPAVESAFKTTPWVDWLGKLVQRNRSLIERLANIETSLLEEELNARPVRRPIYICGLARAGTTILLEIANAHPDTGTHQYRDFPLVHLPYWWSRMLDRIERGESSAKERAHGDRILVTPSSPEAMEEVIWMHWFGRLHDPSVSNILDQTVSNPEFERYYRNHVAKLLLARGAGRYVSKGNYNLTRIAYLRNIFPDARFVIPVRNPLTQVPSLMRQHERFTEGLAGNPAGIAHLQRVGHFEFGPDRRPINAGSTEVTDSISRLWSTGEQVRGWARYWSEVNGHVIRQLRHDTDLARNCLVIRYEDMCDTPRQSLTRFFKHCELEQSDAIIEDYSRRLSAPDYYNQVQSEEDRSVIVEEAGKVAVELGYDLG